MTKKNLIGLVLYPGTTPLDLVGPYEIFSRIPNAEAHVISATLDPVPSERGLRIVPDSTYDTCPLLDVLFIPGGPGQINAQDDHSLMHFISQYADKKDCIISSVCTGALILGAAGFLRGKKATTHWSCMDILPLMGAIPVDMPVVEDGNIITGAGVTNGIDLALCLSERLFGKEATRRIARHIEYPHASLHTDKTAIEQLSKTMLPENPQRKIRLEAAKQTAKRLGVPV